LVAAHKVALDARYDERAARAPADDDEALEPARRSEAENAAWRTRRRAELRTQGLIEVTIDERLADTGRPGAEAHSRAMSESLARQREDD
jgi:hypothetical protein